MYVFNSFYTSDFPDKQGILNAHGVQVALSIGQFTRLNQNEIQSEIGTFLENSKGIPSGWLNDKAFMYVQVRSICLRISLGWLWSRQEVDFFSNFRFMLFLVARILWRHACKQLFPEFEVQEVV